MVHRHTRVDGSEINSHIIDQDKFLPRFNQFKPQEQAQGQAWFILTGTTILRSNDGAVRPPRFDVLDCLAAITSRIPDQREQKVHYYGLL